MYNKSIIKGIALAAAHNIINLLTNVLMWLPNVKIDNFILFLICPIIYIVSIIVFFSADSYEKQTVSCLIYIISGFIIDVLSDVFGIYVYAFQAIFPGGEMWLGEGLAMFMSISVWIVSALSGIGLLFIIRAVRFKMRKSSINV